MKILLVDDEPELLAQLQQTLSCQKYDVDRAADGQAALDRIFDGTYDLILLDIMLPKIDGLAVLKEIRQAEIRTPVIMLTAKGSGMLLNCSELARDTGIGIDTSRRYLQYLALSYQSFLLQPYYGNLTSSVVKTPKIYWSDIGILRQLTGFRGEITGPLYETMVVSEIIKILKTAQIDSEIYFYRTRSGMELDILLKTRAGFIGMEIKSRQTIANKDMRVLKEIASRLGKQWLGEMVIYRGNEIKRIGQPQIWAVPSRRLFQSPLPP